MARVFTIRKSRKATKCGRCGDTIPAGSTYHWLKPRYGGKKVRCVKYACRFRASDKSGAKTAVVYDAIEDAEQELQSATSHEDIQSVLQNVADVAREVAGEYQEANDTWTQNGASDNSEWVEKADECESFADTLESWEFSGEHDEDEVKKEEQDIELEPAETYEARMEAQDEAWEQRLEEMKEDAISALSEFSL
jgi:hypothetical protein